MSQSRKIKKLTILFSHRASGRKLARLVRWGSKREIDRERGGKNIAGHQVARSTQASPMNALHAIPSIGNPSIKKLKHLLQRMSSGMK